MQWELQDFMPTSSGVTALFLQKIPSVAGLQPCLAYR